MEQAPMNMGACEDCLKYSSDPWLCCPMAQMAREGKREFPTECDKHTPLEGG